MIIIAHRRNTMEQLKQTDRKYGIEMDVRTYGNKIIVQHDPFKKGIPFEKWIKNFKHKLLIINTKEDGLESRILAILKKHKIKNFFFLDQSFPTLLRTAKDNNGCCAVRVSEHEPVEAALRIKGLAKWVWIDYFTKFPLSATEAGKLKKAGFKLCIVSPELQGHPLKMIPKLKATLARQGIIIDAVCTKQPAMWEK